MKHGFDDWAGKAATLVAAGSGAALSLWWCFLGPSSGWGLWVPVVSIPILGAAMWRFGTGYGAGWRPVRGGESAGAAARERCIAVAGAAFPAGC